MEAATATATATASRVNPALRYRLSLRKAAAEAEARRVTIRVVTSSEMEYAQAAARTFGGTIRVKGGFDELDLPWLKRHHADAWLTSAVAVAVGNCDTIRVLAAAALLTRLQDAAESWLVQPNKFGTTAEADAEWNETLDAEARAR